MTKKWLRRRDQLVTRAENQRAALSWQMHDWQRPLEIVDRALAIVRYAKSHPLLVALPFGLFAFRRPRTLLRWFNRGWLAQEVLRKLFFR
jgi:YqjK-like protein